MENKGILIVVFNILPIILYITLQKVFHGE